MSSIHVVMAAAPPRSITTEVCPEGDIKKMLDELLTIENLIRAAPSPWDEDRLWKEVTVRLRVRVAVARSQKACRNRFEAAVVRWKAAGAPSAQMEAIHPLRAARLVRLVPVPVTSDTEDEEYDV